MHDAILLRFCIVHFYLSVALARQTEEKSWIPGVHQTQVLSHHKPLGGFQLLQGSEEGAIHPYSGSATPELSTVGAQWVGNLGSAPPASTSLLSFSSFPRASLYHLL